MKFTEIKDIKSIQSAYRTLHSVLRNGVKTYKAVVGYHGGNARCRVGWSDQRGFWVMYPPRGWNRNLSIFGTQNPLTHRSRSLNISCQVNFPVIKAGRRTAGAVLSDGKRMYLAHNGGLAGGAEGVGKTAFLNWYEQRYSNIVSVNDDKYILIGPMDSPRLISKLGQFIEAVDTFKLEVRAHGSVDEELDRDADEAHDEGEFSPRNVKESKEKALRSINIRRGQPEFRKKLLKAYDGRCAICECDCPDALEAAHIRPYGVGDSNHVQNGILLRSDLHTLFDLGKIGVDPNTYKIVVKSELMSTAYGKLNGKKLHVPKNSAHWPNKAVLAEHLKAWKLL